MENYSEIILELMSRIQKLEKQVSELKNYIDIKKSEREVVLARAENNMYLFEGKRYNIPETVLLLIKQAVKSNPDLDSNKFIESINRYSKDKTIMVRIEDLGESSDEYFNGPNDYVELNNTKYYVYKCVDHRSFMFIRHFIKENFNIEVSLSNERDTSRYAFNGRNDLKKSELVYEVVKKYIDEHPNVTIEKMLYDFPRSIQGSLGVFGSVEEIDKKYLNNPMEKRKRYFVEKKLYLNNDEAIYICSQWGVGNIYNFIKHCKTLGYNIETASSFEN